VRYWVKLRFNSRRLEMKDEELESFKFAYCGFCGHIHNLKHDACLYPENNPQSKVRGAVESSVVLLN
jgi:hypothetical protein